VTGVTAIHLPIGSNHRALRAAGLPRAEARRELGLPEDRIVVLFVGNLYRSKGVRELADAVVSLGDPFLGVFVGPGPEAGYGDTDPGRPGRLTYVGSRPHLGVAKYLSAADVLVLPSYSEGLPTVIVEAGSLGLPVIASAVGGIPELLGDGRGTLLPDVSVGSIAAALRTFAADREGAAAAAGRLGEYVLERYDVDRNAARLVELYGEARAGRA
jgi:teichuronic acid biosynthesis glycosyltransferase TuaC